MIDGHRILRPQKMENDLDNMHMRKKDRIIQRAKRLRDEIKQIIDDAEHWNSSVRTRFQQPIDPDPDGVLDRMAKSIDQFLMENDVDNMHK